MVSFGPYPLSGLVELLIPFFDPVCGSPELAALHSCRMGCDTCAQKGLHAYTLLSPVSGL